MDPAAFYDDFISKQVASGINDRIYRLYKKLGTAGLSADSRVLEIGCGIGTLTYLLGRKVSRGYIESVDVSPKSIAFAREHIRRPHIRFSTADIMDYTPGKAPFDFILLFDVLEHIPEERHPALFKRIAGWMHENTRVLINIPNPAYILFDQQHNPAALQETDQPIYTDALSAAMSAASLEIVSMETHSVWVREDYRFMEVRQQRPFREILLSTERNIFQKGWVWLGRQWRKFRFPYPPGK